MIKDFSETRNIHDQNVSKSLKQCHAYNPKEKDTFSTSFIIRIIDSSPHQNLKLTVSTKPFQARKISKASISSAMIIDEAKRNKAAFVIQRAYKKKLASDSYRHMIVNSERIKFFAQKDGGKYTHFRKYHESNQQSISPTQVLSDMDKFSGLCLKECKDALGDLNSIEKSLERKINSCSMKFMHRSNQQLVTIDDKTSIDKLVIFSNKKLIEKNITTNQHTWNSDKTLIANNDFVFFTPYFVSDSTDASEIEKLSLKYGPHAYIIDESKVAFGYLTFTDQASSSTSPEPWSKFPILRRQLHCRASGKETKRGNKDVYMFTQKDMKSAITYYIIGFLRKLTDRDIVEKRIDPKDSRELDNALKLNKEFIDYVLDDTRSLDEIRSIVTALLSPEFHIPRIVAETDLEIKIRNYTR